MVTLTAPHGAALMGEARRANRRIAAGIALSLAMHAFVLNLQRVQSQRAVEAPPRSIAVRLRAPPAPAPAPAPAPRVEAAPPASKSVPRAAFRAQRAAPGAVIAVDPAREAALDPFTVQQAPESAPDPDTPRFDREAARKMARSLANLRDPAREGTAIGQFPDKPLATETRAARAIGAAKRRDCKDGVPGGLLAPLLLLADKKDSGCKW